MQLDTPTEWSERMELALNILGLLVCTWLAFSVLRSTTENGRSYIACFAIVLICISLIFPAISMTDDLATGIVIAHDTSFPQLKLWLLALQMVLLAALFLSVSVPIPRRISVGLGTSASLLLPSPVRRRANSLRAPPTLHT